jgi:hypothetical protein
MNTDRSTQEDAARRQRGRRLAWIAVGAAIAAMLTALAPERATDPPRAGLRLLDDSAPAMPQRMASMSTEVDWAAVEAAPDPSPLSVGAYER